MTAVELQFEIGQCNGSMSMWISDQDHMILYHWDLPKTYKVKFKTRWPNEIKIVLDQKDMRQDTKIDELGNIVANKYIKLTAMSVGGLNVDTAVLYNICNYQTATTTANEIFWDQPGTVLITLDHANPMRWNLANNNLLNFRND